MNTINVKYLSLIAMITAAFAVSSCGGNSDMQTESPSKLQSGPPPASAPANLVATFTGPRNNYTVTRTTTGFTVKDNVGGATTNLTTQTSIKFSDVTINLLVGDKSKTIPASSLKTLIELYIAFFNRVPDADGMNYWIGEIKAGMTLDQLASNFYVAALQFSSVTGYSPTMTNEEFVLVIYKNVLGRSATTTPPDADGVAYWTEEIRSGKSSRGALIGTMLNSAHNYAGDPVWGWVPQLLDNKVLVGNYFSIQQGLNYNTPEESISKGILIGQAVTPTDVLAARAKIGLTDVLFDLTAAISTSDFDKVQAIVNKYCLECHAIARHENGISLHTPALIRQNANALFITTVVTRSMPQDKTLTAEEIAAINTWFKNGAK
jgi:mono/diheme cytochrome c family protein